MLFKGSDAMFLPVFRSGCKKVRLLLIKLEQFLPFLPLCLALGNLSIEILGDVSHCNAILRLQDEFPFLEKPFLEVLNLSEKFNDAAADRPYNMHNLEPGF